jgi:hypothetical protein
MVVSASDSEGKKMREDVKMVNHGGRVGGGIKEWMSVYNV